MALDYRKCAEELVPLLGGKENLISAAHCATRLRLVVADNSKIDQKAIENVEGVKGTFQSNGQFQIIIGTGTVNKVYDEFLAVTGLTAAAAAAAKAPVWRRMLKTVGDVFVPILPAIVASGLMMGIVEALGHAIPGFSDSDWYGFLDLVSNTAFTFLPVIVAISAARVFGGNLFLGAVIGLMMVHPSLTNGWNAADGYDVWYLFGHGLKIGSYTFGQVNQLGYQGHVIPVIIAVYFMSKLEKWLHKHVPEIIDLFVTPLTTVFVTALLTFMIIGPIFSTAETYVLTGAKWLITAGYGIGAAAMGAIYPITVVMGLHHMYNVIEAGMLAEGGLNIWMPLAFGACLAVGVKTRNAKRRSVAIPSALSASLGITEPAIFGVNLRLYKPFVFGMIGGAVGALFGSLSGLGATAYGVTGIPGLLTIDNIPVYLVLLAISGGIAFALTFFFWHEDPEDNDKYLAEKAANEEKALKEEAEHAPVVISSSAGKIYAPVSGKIVPYTEIPDATFAAGTLGEGVGIEPDTEIILAPYDGTISSVAETKHAIGITGENDQEVLIHVGIDTVQMNGDGFTPLVKEDDQVKKGQPILRFSKEKIAKAGHSDMVCVLLTNSDDYEDVKIGADAE